MMMMIMIVIVTIKGAIQDFYNCGQHVLMMMIISNCDNRRCSSRVLQLQTTCLNDDSNSDSNSDNERCNSRFLRLQTTCLNDNNNSSDSKVTIKGAIQDFYNCRQHVLMMIIIVVIAK